MPEKTVQKVKKNLKNEIKYELTACRGSSAWESTRLSMISFEGEAEDRVVAGSNLALGTTMDFWNKPTTLSLPLTEQLNTFNFADIFKSLPQPSPLPL